MSDAINTDSKACRVIFYEDRARVVREATVDVAAGVNLVRVRGVTVLIDDTSLSVDASSTGEGRPPRVLTSRVYRSTRRVSEASGDEVDRLEQRLRQAQQAVDAARRRVKRLAQRDERLLSLEQGMLEELSKVSAADETDPTSWHDGLECIDQRFDDFAGQRRQAREALDEAQREAHRATQLYERATALRPEVSACAEVQIEAEEAGRVEITLSYSTPCALWRPSHTACLEHDSSSGTVTVETHATVWQRTGEVWEDVSCSFSTARPTQAASPPLLTDDWLSARAKSDDERNEVRVEAREVEIATTGVEGGGRDVDEMPGVDDGGEPLTLCAAEPVSIPSNGEPFRVKVGTVELPAQVDVVAYPEISPAAHLRARATWRANYPLLAGPVVLKRRREYAGRSRAKFVPVGEALELGFGIESALSIHRKTEETSKTTKLTGKKRLERRVELFMSNLEARERQVTVIERIPVSEIEDVEIDEITGASPDSDGFAHIEVTLAARETKTHEVSYRVQHGSKVKLRW